MRNVLIAVAFLALIGVIVIYALTQDAKPPVEVPGNGNGTVDGGMPVPDITYVNASENDIVVTSPDVYEAIDRTFTISGKARGPWYFEASFPFEVRDDNGGLLLQTHAEAQGEWMTTEFVPFARTVTIPGSYTGPATLILRKDNPSGLPEHDASVTFPITIK